MEMSYIISAHFLICIVKSCHNACLETCIENIKLIKNKNNNNLVNPFIRQNYRVNITNSQFLASKCDSKDNEETLEASCNKLPDLCSLHYSFSRARCWAIL